MKSVSLEAEKAINDAKPNEIKNNQGIPAQSASITRPVKTTEGEPLVQIGPRLPKSLVSKLRVYASLEDGLSEQDIVRMALEKFFARKNVPGFD